MTTDFRALCAELVEKLDELDRLLHGAQYVEHPLTYRARAALAEPQPGPPTEREVTKLVAWLLEGGEDAAANGWDHQARQFGRAAELLQRLQPEPPTDEELDGLFTEIDQSGEAESWRAYARAVLARWGNS